MGPPENSVVGESQTNGAIERAVQDVKGQVRTVKVALERKLKVKLKEDRVVLAWLVDYVGIALSRIKVNADGRTGYQNIKGKIKDGIGGSRS